MSPLGGDRVRGRNIVVFQPASVPSCKGREASRARALRGARWTVCGVLAALGVALPACRDQDGKGATRAAARHGEDEHAGHDHAHCDEGRSDEVTLTPEAIERYGITVERASLHRLRPTFVAPARVAFNAEAMAHVGSPLPGRVVELRAKLGDVVGKGDVLLVVESPELGEAQSDFLQKRIAAQTAVAGVELARNALDRAARLFEQNRGIALDEVQKREVEYKSAHASLQAAQSAAVAGENRLHLLGMDQASVERLIETAAVNPRFTIVAPLPGRVVQREVTLGELVRPEKEALMVLADTTTLWVLADVPEARLPDVALGADAWLNSGWTNAHKHEGQVSYISPMIDPRTRSAQVRIAVECEHGMLWPGMFAQVEITATDPSGPDVSPVVAVPEEAVQTIEGASSVFVPVPGEPNTFARRAITVGKPVAGLVPVYFGLVEGEPVVASGSFILKADLAKGSAEHEH
jgi:cobalt-zinc-cadmium efflux system membrane fusion protein